MNGYLLSVIATILLSAILTAITPKGKTSTVIKGITKLACLLVIISPIFQYIGAGNAFSQKNSSKNLAQSVIRTDESFISYYSEMRISLAEAQLEEEIENTFGVVTETEFSYEQTGENIKITKITVKMSDENDESVVVNKEKIVEYLTENYGVEVCIE